MRVGLSGWGAEYGIKTLLMLPTALGASVRRIIAAGLVFWGSLIQLHLRIGWTCIVALFDNASCRGAVRTGDVGLLIVLSLKAMAGFATILITVLMQTHYFPKFPP